MSELGDILDVLASHGSSLDAAGLARGLTEDLAYDPDVVLSRLQGRPDFERRLADRAAKAKESGGSPPEEELKLRAEIEASYKQTAAYLPEPQKPLRVSFHRGLSESLLKNNQLSPRVLNDLNDLQGDLYKRLGLNLPGVRFYYDDDLKPDQYRIEIMGENKPTPGIGVEASNVRPEQGWEKIRNELRRRYLAEAPRLWIVESTYWELRKLPDGLQQWLLKTYTVGDLTKIFRAVIAPHAQKPAGSSSNGAVDPGTSAHTLRHLRWLLESLVFWVNFSDPLDGKQIVQDLVDTQRARMQPGSRTGAPVGEIARLLQDGFTELNGDNPAKAAELFREAVAKDRDAARRSFLASYPQRALKRQREDLEALCKLPAPGEITERLAPNVEQRYRIEAALEEGALPSDDELRKRAQLALLWNYATEKDSEKAHTLAQQLSADSESGKWTPEQMCISRVLADLT